MALQYGTSTALTITAGSLAVNTARSSAPITSALTNNTTDYLISVNVLTTTTAATVNKQVVVYAYRSENGTDYQGGSATVDNIDITGGANNVTIGTPSNLTFLGTIQLNNGTTALTLRQVFSLAQAFGSIPPKWGIVLLNDNGAAALGATVSATYREVYYS
jgi:hypothetical protein